MSKKSLSYKKIFSHTLGSLLFIAAFQLVFLGNSFFQKKHTVLTGVITPPPVITPINININPSKKACTNNAPLEKESAIISLISNMPTNQELVKLRVVITGKNYHSESKIIGGSKERLTGNIIPPNQPTLTTVCLQNIGQKSIVLLGTAEERVRGKTKLTVDGKPSLSNITMSFSQKHPETLFSALPVIVRRASLLTGGLPNTIVWSIFILFGVGLPFCTARIFVMGTTSKE